MALILDVLSIATWLPCLFAPTIKGFLSEPKHRVLLIYFGSGLALSSVVGTILIFVGRKWIKNFWLGFVLHIVTVVLGNAGLATLGILAG